MTKVLPYVFGVVLSAAAVMASADTAGQAAAPGATKVAEEAAPAAAENDEFGKLDANHDGSIDAAEAKADKALHKAFSKIAKAGKLSKADYDKWAEKHKKG